MLKCARVAAGDRTLVLLAVGDVDERVVPADAAAAAVDIFLHAGADDAADILLAAEPFSFVMVQDDVSHAVR